MEGGRRRGCSHRRSRRCDGLARRLQFPSGRGPLVSLPLSSVKCGCETAQRDQLDARRSPRGRAIYRELEARPIERSCTRLTDAVAFRSTGRTPYSQSGGVVAAKAWRASGRKSLPKWQMDHVPARPEEWSLRGLRGAAIWLSHPFLRSSRWTLRAREVDDLIHRLEISAGRSEH
jgi:hypothetical protein